MEQRLFPSENDIFHFRLSAIPIFSILLRFILQNASFTVTHFPKICIFSQTLIHTMQYHNLFIHFEMYTCILPSIMV